MAKPISALLLDHVINGDGGDQRLYEEFMDGAWHRGLSYYQAIDELRAREALAQVRRLASDAVVEGPVHWYLSLQTIKASVVSDLALDRPDIARAVASTLEELTYADILYPDAARAVSRLYYSPLSHRNLSMDQRAALRILR